MERSVFQVLIVDDYEPWRRFVRLTLRLHENLRIIGEAADGMEAFTRATELQPDLILLDIGLPGVNGIEAARRIVVSAPQAKILFVSENRAWEIAEAGLRAGGSGYVFKSDAARELLPAVKAVLEGRQFLSASLAGRNRNDTKDEQAYELPHSPANGNHHQVKRYPDDAALVEGLTAFIATTLKNGDAVVVLATESHRASILQKLRIEGVDVTTAVADKRYVPLNVPDSLPWFQVAERLTAETVRTAAKRNLHVGVG